MQCFDEVAAMPIVIQRQVRPSLNQVTKNAEILQTQYIDKVAMVFMVIQRQVLRPSLNHVTKHGETLQLQYIDKVAAMPVVTQRQVPRIQTVLKSVKVLPAQFVGTKVMLPVIMLIMRQISRRRSRLFPRNASGVHLRTSQCLTQVATPLRYHRPMASQEHWLGCPAGRFGASGRSCNTRALAIACAGLTQRRHVGDALIPRPEQDVKRLFTSMGTTWFS